ncbi:hypothetical protein GW17_00059488 [Ensete ventricosum]|nr:hypothetical protein GW17_00059488 [Ensete ventricosum]
MSRFSHVGCASGVVHDILQLHQPVIDVLVLDLLLLDVAKDRVDVAERALELLDLPGNASLAMSFNVSISPEMKESSTTAIFDHRVKESNDAVGTHQEIAKSSSKVIEGLPGVRRELVEGDQEFTGR